MTIKETFDVLNTKERREKSREKHFLSFLSHLTFSINGCHKWIEMTFYLENPDMFELCLKGIIVVLGQTKMGFWLWSIDVSMA